MSGYGKTRWWERVRRTALDIDARFDHGLHAFGRRIRDGYDRYSVALERLSVSATGNWPSTSQARA